MRDEEYTMGLRPVRPEQRLRETRRRAILALAYMLGLRTSHCTVTEEDQRQTRRDLRVAIIFGIVAASLELGVLIYFFR